jgi:aryl-alcohol dehydrogenase-like predicted oxidoreductase
VFDQTTFDHDSKRDDNVPILETATALKELIEEGKIHYIGISNESTFGVCEWIRACNQLGIHDKLASIQNSYSLLDRRFDSELAEACDHYDIGLLPWSVLAGGLLSDQHTRGNSIPPNDNSRYVCFPNYMRRWHPSSATRSTLDATEEYARIALEAGMTPAELAMAFVRSRRFVKENGSVIVGATTMEQLKENLRPFDRKDVKLDDEILARINEVHLRCRDPSCSFKIDGVFLNSLNMFI